MKKKKRALTLIAAILCLMIVTVVVYVMDYYHAQGLEEMKISSGVSIEHVDNMIVVAPQNPRKGLIFYPGAKVEATSYEPLMNELASRSIECVIVEMPGNLALLDKDAASEVIEKITNIDEWYIGGHSLGGVVATMYAQDHPDVFEGIVYVASYPACDLSGTDLKMLSIYGTQDCVLNMQSYEESKAYVTNNYEEHVIEGGCHAYFGNYGPQKKDGYPTITREYQQLQTADIVATWMLQN